MKDTMEKTVETPELVKPKGTYRYRILAMLFFATTINYMDRSII